MRGIFLDISNAFYKVCHDSLLFKLKAFDVQGELLSLWRNFKSPKAQTKSGLKWSNFRVERSHFWRSVLRSILFLIYINDGITLLCKNSSDDTFLFSKVHNINKSVNELNADLEKISQWAYQWKMHFNLIPRNKQMKLFSVVNLIHQTFSICLLNLIIIALLLLLLNFKLDFNSYVDEKNKKCNKLIGLIKRL